MKLDITITPQDIQNLQTFVSSHQHRTFVVQRIKRNIDENVTEATKEDVWLTMTMCQLTSQQRSSPTSQVSKFLLENPFRVSWAACSNAESIETFIQNEISHFGGIRFAPKIARQMALNLFLLESGEWENLQKYLVILLWQQKQKPDPDHYRLEWDASNYIQRFYGFGPKQSRNFWQALEAHGVRQRIHKAGDHLSLDSYR